MTDLSEQSDAEAGAAVSKSAQKTVVNFATEDVLKVARALIEDAVYWDNDDNNSMNSYPGHCCKYCSMARIEDLDNIKHALNCPVLVAIDLTAGS